MRRLNLVLLASLKLCQARSRGFSVYEDLLTFPQFDVVFSEDWVSEQDAQALLEREVPQPTASVDTISQSTIYHDQGDENKDNEDVNVSYELMNLPPHKYLCSIPLLQPEAPENKTANELAKAEEAQELSRATVNGWELLSGLSDSCLYFMSGWWSYRFCKNHEIVQFHAVTTGKPGQPPRRDPQTAEFVLGAVPALPSTSLQKANQGPDSKPLPAEVQVKGNQRYLVQKLEGGTICDLTGRERTIEVQYHCVPGIAHAKIAWIKEVTICAYLMVVNTPELCQDVAFLPPQEAKAHPVNCQLIVADDATPPLLEQAKSKTEKYQDIVVEQRVPSDQQPLQEIESKHGVVVGGIVVGARNMLSEGDEEGQPPVRLNSPNNFFGDKQATKDSLVELVAQAASKANGGKVEVLGQEDLEDLEINPDDVREMRAEMERLAGDLGWRLEIVELPHENVRELRGYVDDEKEQEEKGKKEEKKEKKEKEEKEEKGSEEKFYKDEL